MTIEKTTTTKATPKKRSPKQKPPTSRREGELRSNGVPAKKPGRKTNAQRLQKAIEQANSKELETSLGVIRAKMVKKLQDAASDDKLDRVGAAEDVKAMHELWKKGKDILADIQREEAAIAQNQEYHSKVIGLADNAITELGWDA